MRNGRIIEIFISVLRAAVAIGAFCWLSRLLLGQVL
jgi:hypothetical protein